MVIDWEIDASESAATPASHRTAPCRSTTPRYQSRSRRPSNQQCCPRRIYPCISLALREKLARPQPFMVEVEHGGTAKSAGVTQSSGPSRELQERERQPQGHPAVNHAVNVPSPIGRLRKLPEDSARNTPSLSHRTRSPDPPQQRTASPQHPVPHLPPSQSAIDTLQHILRLKRKLDRDPDLPEPSIASMSSKPVRKLYPVPKTPQSGSLSRRSPTSSAADVVAAAINEGTQLHRVRHGSIPIPSTPSPRKRPSLFATPVSNKGSSAPQADEGHRTRRSLSLGRYSSPPILFLDPTKSASQSQKPSQGPYREEEYDELELSYPASLTLAPQRDLPDSRPPMVIPTESPRRAKIVSPTSRPSFLDTGSHWIGDSAVMRSSELHYFKRYCQIFDMDRRALADVYAPDAVFSCSSRNLHARGRDDVVEALQALGHGVLCSGSSVEYDVTWLGPGVGVLLVVLGTMRQSGESNGEVGYAMTFVLKSDGDNDERPTGDVRPLVAVVHQMVFRESLSQSR
ncbi:hypothetical protein F5148DRAFT_171192 [Russula earlei]|uniref:Uncharacterized protein n=1 Tax=Russula earlei TaxID=71964 RepID=A0ACC0U6H1_9AGAM|nr:hypothetical protein F5148DRAFT_171192 [Russula earlei]